jgi:hypothetical protein
MWPLAKNDGHSCLRLSMCNKKLPENIKIKKSALFIHHPKVWVFYNGPESTFLGTKGPKVFSGHFISEVNILL